MTTAKAGPARPARNGNVDLLRLIAAIGVILAHVGITQTDTFGAGSGIVSLIRWCVPAFFIITGYYATAADGSLTRIEERVQTLAWIFTVGSAIYLLPALVRYGIGGLSIHMLVIGSWFHLWFLGALIIGLIVVSTFVARGADRALTLLSILILVGLIVAEIANVWTDRQQYGSVRSLFRSSQGIAFIWIGVLMRRHHRLMPTLWTATALFLGGLLLQIVEGVVAAQFGMRFAARELLVGSIPAAVGAFALAQRLPDRVPERLARLCRDLSLPVYVLHPLIITIYRNVIGPRPAELPADLVDYAVCTAISVALALLLRRLLPGLFTLGPRQRTGAR